MHAALTWYLVCLLLLTSFTHAVSDHESELRFNFASAEMGAKVLAANPESKGSHRLLQGDRDKYFANPCNAPRKWVTIELSDENRITTFAMANYEYYSSSVKNFMLLGSTQYPCIADRGCMWQSLGSFVAENHQTMQYFSIPYPQLIRYLKVPAPHQSGPVQASGSSFGAASRKHDASVIR